MQLSLASAATTAAILITSVLFPVPSQARRGCGSPTRAEAMDRLPSGSGEASGFVASRKHPGLGWMIRDSGHPASVYAVWFGKGGASVREVKVRGAENSDWEDLSYSVGDDGRGRLWIVESTQFRRDPYIYVVLEPAPDARKVDLHNRYRYRYPDTRYENTEASFFWRGDLVLVTKTSPPRVYRFDEPLQTDRVNRPRYVGKLKGAKRVSVARPSPDLATLVTSDHETITVYKSSGPEGPLSQFTYEPPARRQVVGPDDNIEAGDYFPWSSCDMVMLSERRNVYRLRD